MASLRITASPEGVTLAIRVVPRASQNEIVGISGDALKVRLTAPPTGGAANAALIEFLAARLHVRRAQVTLVAGHSMRLKLVRIDGLSTQEIETRLLGKAT